MFNFFEHFKFFLWVVFIFSLKHVGLLLYGYFKYGMWYWADDALIDILRISIIIYLAVFIRRCVGYYLSGKGNENK